MKNTGILLAAHIQMYRKKAGLTQEKLAEKLVFCQIDTEHIVNGIRFTQMEIYLS